MDIVVNALNDDFTSSNDATDWSTIDLDQLTQDVDWDSDFKDAMDDISENPIKPEDITMNPLTHIAEDISDDEDLFEDALSYVKQVSMI